MTLWTTCEDEAPDLAAAVRARFGANTHHVLATIRSDGSPRVSGTEIAIHEGRVCFGAMWRSRKALDLFRDPRLAVHSTPSDPEMTGGDAKLSGRATELTDDDAKKRFLDDVFADRQAPPDDDPWHLFAVDLSEVVLTEVDAEAGVMTMRLWKPGAGVVVHQR